MDKDKINYMDPLIKLLLLVTGMLLIVHGTEVVDALTWLLGCCLTGLVVGFGGTFD